MPADTVWTTGASSGIGRALALALARQGQTVVASARRADELGKLAAEDPGGRIHAWPLDVTDGAAVARAVEAIERGIGEIATAVLAAGTHRPVRARDFRAAELETLFRVNVLGTANCLEALIGRMTVRRKGRIAVVSSVAGYGGLPSAAYYGATKAALINMTESLRFDLAPAGVRLQLIDPGFVRTPLTDKNTFQMPFLIEPEAAAAAILRGLASDRFEIHFPRRFTYLMKMLGLLPYRLYFPLVARLTGK
jgi:NAD(P)-dependent dehydrogenase (short-subunit alcohol dehydrogenase family)